MPTKKLFQDESDVLYSIIWNSLNYTSNQLNPKIKPLTKSYQLKPSTIYTLPHWLHNPRSL